MGIGVKVSICRFSLEAHVHETSPTLERSGIAIKKIDNLFPSHMEGFVITCVLKPFNLTWRVDGVASTTYSCMMRTTLPWLVWRRAAQVRMSNRGSSWLSMPVTETVLPVLSKILTSDPARPPLAPLSIRDP